MSAAHAATGGVKDGGYEREQVQESAIHAV